MAARWGSQTFSEARNSQAAKRSWHSPALSRQWLRRTSLSTMKRRPQRPLPQGDIQRGPWRKEAVCQEHEMGHGKMSEQHMDSNCWQGMIYKRLKAMSKKISSVFQHLCQSINGQIKHVLFLCTKIHHRKWRWDEVYRKVLIQGIGTLLLKRGDEKGIGDRCIQGVQWTWKWPVSYTDLRAHET